MLNLYIHNYDLLSSQCHFAHNDAPIRILAFGDPQIRGSSPGTPLRNKLDIFGNDYFLGHVYKVTTGRLDPTHIAVMGDLLSSQWIKDDEFFRRVERYKKRIFRPLYIKSPEFINISGNHDVGYSGEMTTQRIERYEKAFGKVNFIRVYITREGRPWRLVVLNSLALDGPWAEKKFHDDTVQFLEQVKRHKVDGPTILLTHVPMYKEAGICVDGPYFKYYSNGALRSQNHLSIESTQLVINSVFGEHGGIIMTGHDHEGCESVYRKSDSGQWVAERINSNLTYPSTTSIKEFTVRSMMGEYGGNSGLMTAVVDDEGNWQYEYSLCRFAVQHIWWVTKVVTNIAMYTLVIYITLLIAIKTLSPRRRQVSLRSRPSQTTLRSRPSQSTLRSRPSQLSLRPKSSQQNLRSRSSHANLRGRRSYANLKSPTLLTPLSPPPPPNQLRPRSSMNLRPTSLYQPSSSDERPTLSRKQSSPLLSAPIKTLRTISSFSSLRSLAKSEDDTKNATNSTNSANSANTTDLTNSTNFRAARNGLLSPEPLPQKRKSSRNLRSRSSSRH
ncbi:hypothetical protein TRVA0_008S01970 [Trichomonascus vanleenenianus]|uniref:Ted1p n=1 Tax=Trichomonascus vanleenenianus TaxID=2268995 RepID=UPI003ECB134B